MIKGCTFLSTMVPYVTAWLMTQNLAQGYLTNYWADFLKPNMHLHHLPSAKSNSRVGDRRVTSRSLAEVTSSISRTAQPIGSGQRPMCFSRGGRSGRAVAVSRPPDTLGRFRTRAGFRPMPHIHALGTASGVSQSGLACTWTPRVSETGHFGTRAGCQ
jgi:hypothetical protein